MDLHTNCDWIPVYTKKTQEHCFVDIMVVATETAGLALLSDILSTAGYQVCPVKHGELTLRSARSKRPDLILLDFNLPDMDSIEVCRSLKSDPTTSDLPVIFISPLEQVELRRKALEAGAVDCITGPFESAEILAQVSTHLNLYRLQRTLRQEKERAQQYLDTAGVMLISLDNQQSVTMINPKGCEVLGCPREEIVGQNWFDTFLPRENTDEVRRVFDQIMSGDLQSVEYYESPILRGDGQQRIIAWHNSILRNGSGQIIGLFSSGEDVTERKRAQDALQESERFAKRIVESSLNGIYVYDLEEQTNVYINPQYTKLTGWTLEDLQALDDKAFLQLFHPDELEAVLVHMQAVQQADDADILEIEYRFRTVEGEWIWCLSRDAVFLRDAQGKVKQLIGTFLDITKRRCAEQAAREAQDQLVEQGTWEKGRVEAELLRVREELIRKTRLAAIGQISASIAHDLRNPLASVHNALHLLRYYLPHPEDKIARQLAVIDQELQRSNGIITCLLDLVRARLPDKQEISLNQLVQEVMAEASMPEGIGWRIATEPDPLYVYADRTQLKQLVHNILANALEAMAGAGEFVVHARQEESQVAIRFLDTGPGLDKEIRERLFEPLITTKTTGTGLGLTICRDIIGTHGGTIRAENRSGQGAVIYVMLPCA